MDQAPCILKVRIRYCGWRCHRNVGHQSRLLIVLAEGGRGKQRECEAKHQRWLLAENTGLHYFLLIGLEVKPSGGSSSGKLLNTPFSWVSIVGKVQPRDPSDEHH